MYDVGLQVNEGLANGASSYSDPSKRNIGLLGQFTRGAALTPIKVTSLEDFNVIFGGQNTSFYGPGIVRSIFLEAGNAPVTLYIARVVGSSSAVATATGTITGSGSSAVTMTVKAGYRGSDDPGAWANGIKANISIWEGEVRGMYTFTVTYGDKKETYNGTTFAEIQTAVNRYSKYVTVVFNGEDGTHVASAATEVTLASGADGTVAETDFTTTDAGEGFYCFVGEDVQIIAATEYHSKSVALALNSFLNAQASPVGVCNLPLNATDITVEDWADSLQTSGKSYLAMYDGWVKVPDDNGNLVLLPAIGSILGSAYLRTPYVQGDYIHIPPGGTDSVFNYVSEVVQTKKMQSMINKYVQQFSCNVIRYVESIGTYVGSSRTLSTNDLYCSMHIRMQTSYYVRLLLVRMRYMEQKLNTPELRIDALTKLHTFFKGEYDVGALERNIAFEDAYKGICDSTNNPYTQDRKLLNITVMWIPSECTESIVVELQRNDGILNAMEG